MTTLWLLVYFAGVDFDGRPVEVTLESYNTKTECVAKQKEIAEPSVKCIGIVRADKDFRVYRDRDVF